MKLRHILVLLTAIACTLAGPPAARAADWPQFQGPGASGISPETGLARSWPEGGQKVLWTVDLGIGFGGAAVRDGKVFVLDRVDDRQDVLRCLDLATGKEEWTYAYDAPGSLEYNGSRQVPLVEEAFVYTVGPFGHVTCISRATHQAVWSHNLVRDFRPDPPDPADPAKPPTWGVSQCPVAYQDTIIVAPETAGVGVVAYEKATGRVRWKSPPVGPNGFCYVTPTLVRLCGVDQVIVMANKVPEKVLPAIISSVGAADGRLLWRLETARPYKLPISCPVQIADDRLFVSGSYGLGCFVLKLAKDGDRWTTSYVFKDNDNCFAHLHTPILYQGRLYAQSFDIHKAKGQNGLECLDLDGRILWKSGPDVTFDAGAFLIADGLIFVLHGKTGELCLAEASPAGYKELARAKVLTPAQGDHVWAPMALADGKLLVRDQHQMKCVEVRK